MRNHALAAHHPPHVHRRVHSHHAFLVPRLIVERYLALPIGILIALVAANTIPEAYFIAAQALAFPVNDIAMALFIGLVTQEVVEATMAGGALHSWKRWTLPVLAAAGGVAGSAAVYLGYVGGHHEQVLGFGWPIASAVDIAAAYYVTNALLPRSGAVPFVLLLALASDLLGMVIVATRHPILSAYSDGAALALIAVALAATLRSLKVRSFWPYILGCGALSWIAFFRAGLHPAFALVPIVPFMPHEPRRLDLFADPPDDDAVHHFEHEWNGVVQVVLLLFGLVNGGVILRGYDTGTWALLTAALVGRPVGILLSVGVAVLAGWHLPRKAGWRQITVAAWAASTGLTIALFFATGTLSTGPILAQLTIGALLTAGGSLVAVLLARVLHVGRFAR
jgi:NhaA family Na+:H+ antiporter